MTIMHPSFAWISADLGSTLTAIMAAAALAYGGFRRGLFLAIVAALTVVTGLVAGVVLAPRMASWLGRLGVAPGSLLPACYFVTLLTIPAVLATVIAYLCEDDDVRLPALVDRVGGAIIGAFAGTLLGGALLVGWSMCELPAGIRPEPPVRSFDAGALSLQTVTRLIEPWSDDRERLLGGDLVRHPGAAGGDVVRATEPFDDVDGDRRRGDAERFIDYNGDGIFTIDQEVIDHPAGEAGRRDTGLLDRYWLSAWRRMRVLHPPRITSRLFVVVSEEAKAGQAVYQTIVDDPDEDEQLRYSLKAEGEQAALLEIDPGTGVVQFRDGAIDPKLRSIAFTVVVEDCSGLIDEKKVEITLRPPDEAAGSRALAP